MSSNYFFPDITLEGILSSRDFVLQKESRDKDVVEAIPFIGTDSLYPRLVEWASHECPDNFAIYTVTIIPPNYCSDGVERTFIDYLNYLCSTGNYLDLIAKLQTRFKDTKLSAVYEGNTISVVISKCSPSE